MITSDGRSIIEAEMEQMRFTAQDFGEERLQLDASDYSHSDSSDPSDSTFSRLVRWFSRIFSPVQA